MADEQTTPPPEAPTQDWRLNLPPEVKDAPSLKDYKDVGSLAKSHVELQKMLGNSLRPPGPDAAPEARQEFLTKLQKQYPELVNGKDENALLSALGKPEDPKEYVAPKDVSLPDDVMGRVRETAKTLGLTKKQAEKAFEVYGLEYTAQQQNIQKAQQALKQEWGAALEERTKLVAVAAEKMGFPPAVVDIIKSGKGSAEEMKAFLNVAKALGLDKPGNEVSQQQGTGGTRTTLTPLEASQQLMEIRKRKEFWDGSSNPVLTEHLRKQVLKLTEIAHAGEE